MTILSAILPSENPRTVNIDAEHGWYVSSIRAFTKSGLYAHVNN
ncbi:MULTISPECIES: hypothetical protein [Aerosakkonema]